jgi:hypothetical protein
MTAPFGPFSVTARQISILGPFFTEFVNRLLAIEAALAPAASLQTNANENDPDGGVDSMIYGFPGTVWIPPGDSVWQFKRGNLDPGECREELRGARWARDLLAHGATYRLVIGVMLGPQNISRRKSALLEEASALGLPSNAALYEVLDANHLARWAELYPALAVTRGLGGPGHVASDFISWSDSIRHNGKWVQLPSRTGLVNQVQETLTATSFTDARIEGVSGLGKTRLVMEALRDHPLRSLVAYIPDEGKADNDYLNHLLQHDRAAVLIIDECTGRRHEKIAEQVRVGSQVRLVTIGEPSYAAIRGPVISLTGASEPELVSVLTEYLPNLRIEALRVVADYAAGNVGYALWIGDQMLRRPEISPAELTQRETLDRFVSDRLPAGNDFLGAAILALFSRIGWDGEIANELAIVAENLEVGIDVLRSAGLALEEAGLLTRQGRYRAVTPHPIAVFLARNAWVRYSEQIVQSLLPALSDSMAYNLFRRAADIGNFEPTRTAVRRLLFADGPFGSLQSLSGRRNAALLTELAIVAPDEVSEQLSGLILGADAAELGELTAIRRDLVWTLEKLAWHSWLFEDAADSLLKLALSENETWGNNATGVWSEMFGTMLPRTSATPDVRANYLRRILTDPRPDARLLAVRASAKALNPHEFTSVSGEIQGGVIVESRGSPQTYGDAFNYQREVISMVRDRVEDEDADVALAAIDVLINAIHSVLDVPPVRNAMKTALISLPPPQLQRVRIELAGLRSLFRRAGDRQDVEARREGLESLYASLPPAQPADELDVLLHSRRWDYEGGQLQSAIIEAIPQVSGSLDLLEILRVPLPAAYELGYGVASVLGPTEELTLQFLARVDANFDALVGYLVAQVDRGNSGAFSSLLLSQSGQNLPTALRVAIAVRAPARIQDISYISDQIIRMPARAATSLLMSSTFTIESDEMTKIAGHWVRTFQDQDDYNALLQFFAVQLSVAQSMPSQLSDAIEALVMRRPEFSEVGREASDWAYLAGLLLPDRAVELTDLMLDLIEADSIRVFGGHDEDATLLARAMTVRPEGCWSSLVGKLQSDSWRVQLSVQSWLIRSVPNTLVLEWVGSSIERARVVASIAETGSERPTPIASFLLTNFGSDEKVASQLMSEFISGVQWGKHSDHLREQVGQLEGWLRGGEPEGVQRWAREVVNDLRASMESAVQREDEAGW